MTRVVSMRLKDDQVKRLERFAKHLGRPISQAAAILLEESLREWEFPEIEFHDSAAGRQHYLRCKREPIYLLAQLADAYEGDTAKVAEHLREPEWKIEGALRYIAAYREEIDAEIEHGRWVAEHVLPTLPGFSVFTVDASK